MILLLFLGVWSIVVIAMVRTLVRKRYQYYSVEIWTRKNFEGIGETLELESSETNVRRCLTTDDWQVCRPRWTHLTPSLSFILKEKGRRFQWIPLSQKTASTVKDQRDLGTNPKIIFGQRLDLPPEGHVEKKKKENIFNALKKASM